MNGSEIFRNAQRYAVRNSPGLLTGLGVAGVISTAVLTAKAAVRADRLIENATIELRQKQRGSLSNREKVEIAWKEFIPPAVVAAVTIAAILGANHISSRRTAAVAAAFKISEKMAEEYRQKVVETMGPQKEEMVRSAVAKERIESVEGVGSLVLTGAQEIYFDAWSGRAFVSTRDKVDAAVNQINHQINHEWAASVSEFYDALNLPRTALSDNFGWNTDEPLDPYYTSTLLDDRRAAVEIRFNTQPFGNFYKHGV